MIKILDSSLTRLGVIKNTLSANRLEAINGENTLDYSATFDGRVAEFVDEDSIYELNDEYFDTAMITKSANDDGTVTVDVEAEHISYRLNDPLYNVDWFTEIGTPSYILGKILEGTGFTVGTVEFTESITYSAQEAKSRRQLLMEFVAYLGGEIGFSKFEVSVFTHRGSTEIVSVEKDRNIKIVSKTVNKRQKDEDGNDLVSYTCTPIFVPGDSYSLGDDIVLIKSSLKLNERLRVVNISYNPYDESQTTLEFANYTNGLESSLFRIETNIIAKGKSYYGARISPENGFESIRSDMKARTVMNADTFAMQVGDGTGEWYNRLWFDPELNLYVFDGTLSANTINAIKAEIDIVITNVTITNTLTAQKGYIADLTVDSLDTSDMVRRYNLTPADDDYDLRKAPVAYQRINDEVRERIVATYVGDGLASQSWTGYPDSPADSLGYQYQAIVELGEDGVFLLGSRSEQHPGTMEHSDWAAWAYAFDEGVYSWQFAFADTGSSPDLPIEYYVRSNHDLFADSTHADLLMGQTDVMGLDAESRTQVTNRAGSPLFYIDAARTGITEDVTAWPVWRLVYDGPDGIGIVKEMEYFHYDMAGNAIPATRHGAGNGYKGRGIMTEAKWADGYEQRYITTGEGAVEPGAAVALKLGDDGAIVTNPGWRGLRNFAVGPTPPENPQINEFWVVSAESYGG